MIAGMACRNAMVEKNAFVYAPHGDSKAIQRLQEVGVRFSSNCIGEKNFVTNNEAPDAATCQYLLHGKFPNPRIKTQTVLLVEANGLRLNDSWRSRIHASFATEECTLEDVANLGGHKMITTHWQAAMIGQSMGMNVLYLSGPKCPPWASSFFEKSSRIKTITISDRGRNSNCPCSSIALCHREDLDNKPCVAMVSCDLVGALKTIA